MPTPRVNPVVTPVRPVLPTYVNPVVQYKGSSLVGPARAQVLPRNARMAPQTYEIGPLGSESYPGNEGPPRAPLELPTGPTGYLPTFDFSNYSDVEGDPNPTTLSFGTITNSEAQDKVLLLTVLSNRGTGSAAIDEPTVSGDLTWTLGGSFLWTANGSDKLSLLWAVLPAGASAAVSVGHSDSTIGYMVAGLHAAIGLNTSAPVVQSVGGEPIGDDHILDLAAFAAPGNVAFGFWYDLFLANADQNGIALEWRQLGIGDSSIGGTRVLPVASYYVGEADAHWSPAGSAALAVELAIA